MAEALFYITIATDIVAALTVGWTIFIHGRQLGGAIATLRQFAAGAFTSLAAWMASMVAIVRAEGVEICASLPLVLMTIFMLTTSMYATSTMGRKHHQNFALWVLVMFVPLVSLLAHLLMKGSNNYHPLFSFDDLNDFCVTTPLIYYGRAIFVAILMTFWLLAVGMIVEAYIYYRKTCATQLKAEDAEQRDGNVKLSIAWALVIIMGLVPWCISSLVLHIVYNLLIFGLLTITGWAYLRHVRFIRAHNSGRLAPIQIARRVPMLLAMEQGGSTEWATSVEQNPFFAGNPTLDDVAQALGVTNTALSDYVLQQDKNNFMAWVCDQRLRYCAEQIASTNRKISEIAISTGYNDLPTFTRAFKRRFGISPSEYRKQNAT